jgi:phosphoglycolate phosphatase-like HAD superfamily hydrolase
MLLPRNRYIFCDLDGTLLHAPNAGRSAFGAAFATAFGVLPDMTKINFAGATDLLVLDELAFQCNLSRSAEQDATFFSELSLELDRKLTAFPPEVFPGVEAFLERVSTNWGLGLVTGNSQSSAWVKIRHAGLERFFGKVGGFGDEHGDRCKMATLAFQRAGKPERAFLLGDTPSDILAAKKSGMVSVAVCNGSFDRAALEATHPDWILDSFLDAEALFEELQV